jgi:transposase
MEQITTIGRDLAKDVFQLHGVMAQGEVAPRGQLRRPRMLVFFARLPPCLNRIEV